MPMHTQQQLRTDTVQTILAQTCWWLVLWITVVDESLLLINQPFVYEAIQ